MRTAIYCRVSTDAQEREGTSLSTQEAACVNLAHKKGYSVTVFPETYSGLSLDRPKLNELRELVRKKQFDVLIVYALDRLSRDPVHILLLQDELERNRVALELVTESIDSSDIGKLVMHVKGYAAKLEAAKILERTVRGKKARARSGKFPSGTYRLFGYFYNKDTGTCTINEQEAPTVRRLFDYLVKGMSTRQIVRQLNTEGIPTPEGKAKWGRSTVRRMLTNSEYCGECYVYKTGLDKKKRVNLPKEQWIALPTATPPIISKETFQQAQDQLKENKHSGPVTHRYQYLLKGMVYCGKCGGRYQGTPTHGKRYYRCGSHNNMQYCHNKSYLADYLENDIWEGTKYYLQHPDELKAEIEKRRQPQERMFKLQGERDIKQNRIDRLKSSIENEIKLCAALDNVDVELISSKIKSLRKEIREIEAEIAILDGQLNDMHIIQVSQDRILEVCEKYSKDIDSATFNQKREILKAFKIKVTLFNDHVEAEGIVGDWATTSQCEAQSLTFALLLN